MEKSPLLASTSEAASTGRAADALRLLFGAQIALTCWSLISFRSSPLSYMRGINPWSPQAIQAMLHLAESVISGVLAFGIVRFVAPLGHAWARRWGYAAAVLFGVGALSNLFPSMLRLAGVEFRTLDLVPVTGFVNAVSTAAMLLAVWKGSLALAAQPPTGVLRFAVGAVALRGVLHPVLPALKLLDFILPILIAGVLDATRSALRRTRAPADGSEWTHAADGLGLYRTGLSARIVLVILVLALPPTVAGVEVKELAILLGVGFGGMMFAGLLKYASLPGMASARGYVYVSLALSIFMEVGTLGAGEPLWAFVHLPICFCLLSGSFRRVAQKLEEPKLARRVLQAMLWILVPVGVVHSLRFFDVEHRLSHFLFLKAAAFELAGVVWWFFLMLRLRRRMLGGPPPSSSVATVPSGSLFRNV